MLFSRLLHVSCHYLKQIGCLLLVLIHRKHSFWLSSWQLIPYTLQVTYKLFRYIWHISACCDGFCSSIDQKVSWQRNFRMIWKKKKKSCTVMLSYLYSLCIMWGEKILHFLVPNYLCRDKPLQYSSSINWKWVEIDYPSKCRIFMYVCSSCIFSRLTPWLDLLSSNLY